MTGLESQEGRVGFKYECLIMRDSHFESHGIEAGQCFSSCPSAEPVVYSATETRMGHRWRA